MTICPDNQHAWEPWSAPVPGLVEVGGVLVHPGALTGQQIDWRPQSQQWSRSCPRCGSRQVGQPVDGFMIVPVRRNAIAEEEA